MKTYLWKLFQYCFVLFITLTIAPPWIVEVCVERPVQEQQQDKCSELYLHVHNWRSLVSKISQILPKKHIGHTNVTSSEFTQLRVMLS